MLKREVKQYFLMSLQQVSQFIEKRLVIWIDGQVCYRSFKTRFNINLVVDLCDHPEYLKVKPVKGRIAMFYNMVEKNNGENTNQSALEIYSLHMGCHVKKGLSSVFLVLFQ